MTKSSSTHQYATLWQRFSAYQVDGLLFALPWIFALWMVSRETEVSRMMATAINQFTWVILPSLFASFIYWPYMTYRWGATLGKMVVGLQVADKNGKLLSLNQAVFRELIVKGVSGAAFGLGWFLLPKHPQRQAWHDELTGSYVYQTDGRAWLGAVIWLGGWVLLGWVMWQFGLEIFSQFAAAAQR